MVDGESKIPVVRKKGFGKPLQQYCLEKLPFASFFIYFSFIYGFAFNLFVPAKLREKFGATRVLSFFYRLTFVFIVFSLIIHCALLLFLLFAIPPPPPPRPVAKEQDLHTFRIFIIRF